MIAFAAAISLCVISKKGRIFTWTGLSRALYLINDFNTEIIELETDDELYNHNTPMYKN